MSKLEEISAWLSFDQYFNIGVFNFHRIKIAQNQLLLVSLAFFFFYICSIRFKIASADKSGDHRC